MWTLQAEAQVPDLGLWRVSEVSGLEPPTSTLRRWLWQTSADVGGPSAQVIDLFTPQRTAVNGGGRGMTAG
jgi:hypothetical protein